MSPIEKLKAIAITPIIPLPLCAAATGLSQQSLKSIARKKPEELTIIRMSERRCGIRQDVLERFLASRQSAVEPFTGTTPRKVLGAMADAAIKRVKAKREPGDGVMVHHEP